jgi:hypothetical protein
VFTDDSSEAAASEAAISWVTRLLATSAYLMLQRHYWCSVVQETCSEELGYLEEMGITPIMMCCQVVLRLLHTVVRVGGGQLRVGWLLELRAYVQLAP